MARQARTIAIGAVAATVGIWWLGRAYDIDNAQLLRFLVASASFVAGLIVLAIGGAWLLRRMRRRPIGMAALARRHDKRTDDGPA